VLTGSIAGRDEEAFSSLVRIRRVPEHDPRLQLEMKDITAAFIFDEESKAERFQGITSRFGIAMKQYSELFTASHLRKRTLIACLLQIIQQFTGINAIIYYAPQIFKAIGLSGNSVDLLATGVVGIINFFSTIPALMFLDRWGRRNVLMVGAIGMATSQLIVGTLFAVYKDNWDSHRSAGWACAVFIWFYISNFAFSIGCVNWIMPSEMFPPGIRGKAVGFAISTNWLTNVSIHFVI